MRGEMTTQVGYPHGAVSDKKRRPKDDCVLPHPLRGRCKAGACFWSVSNVGFRVIVVHLLFVNCFRCCRLEHHRLSHMSFHDGLSLCFRRLEAVMRFCWAKVVKKCECKHWNLCFFGEKTELRRRCNGEGFVIKLLERGD